MVTPEMDIEKAKFSHNYTIHPIFRTRRCISKFINTYFVVKFLIYKEFIRFLESDTNRSADCCMIFIDEHSRIYQNWKDFVENNKLPFGTMIAPSQGCYSFNDDNMVDTLYQAENNNKKKL